MMCALLDFSTVLFTVLIVFLPAMGHPTSEDESLLFNSDSGPLESPVDDILGVADVVYNSDQRSMTNVLALAPPYTEDPDISFQAPTDTIGMDALNPDPLSSLDPPFLLAAEGDWDWDCPEGKQSFCCSERGITPLILTDFGNCRNCGSDCSLLSNLLPLTSFLEFPRP